MKWISISLVSFLFGLTCDHYFRGNVAQAARSLSSFVQSKNATHKPQPELRRSMDTGESRKGGGVGDCISLVEDEVGQRNLPAEWTVLRNSDVSLFTHDPSKEFISQRGYEKKGWWSWGLYDMFSNAVGKYTPARGMFLEVGTNIGTVSMRFAKENIPTLTIEANPQNYVRSRLSRCINKFDGDHTPYVMVNRAIALSDDGPDLFLGQWEGNMGTSHTQKHGNNKTMAVVHPVTLDSLAFGEGPMSDHNYLGLDISSPLWAMKLDCEGCEGAAVKSGKRLLTDTRRHPEAIAIEVTPRYLKNRGGVSALEMYTLLQEAGYKASGTNCHGYLDDGMMNDEYIEELGRNKTQWDCMFVKKRQSSEEVVSQERI